MRGALGSGRDSELLGTGGGTSSSGEWTFAGRGSSGESCAGAGDDSATACERQSLSALGSQQAVAQHAYQWDSTTTMAANFRPDHHTMMRNGRPMQAIVPPEESECLSQSQAP